MSKRRSAPSGTVWKRGLLWGRMRRAGRPAIIRPLHTDDPKVAARRWEAIKAEITGRLKHGEARYSFNDAMSMWAESLTQHVEPITAERYLCSLGQIKLFLHDKYIDQINGPLIAEIIKDRRASGRSIATVKRDLIALSSVMNYCIDEGWIEANPVLPRLGRLKERRDPIILPDPAHIRILIRRAPGRFSDLIAVALETGCRMDELVSAKPAQFADNARQLMVIGKGSRGRGKKMRTINLSEGAYEIIRRAVKDGARWIFSHNGEQYKEVSSRWRDLCRGISCRAGPENDGVVPFPFHNLRHSYAVNYLKTPLLDGSPASIYVLSQHLGHTSVKTTEIYLAYLTAEEKQAVMFGKVQVRVAPKSVLAGNLSEVASGE
jgi:integrase/recombinase XerD